MSYYTEVLASQPKMYFRLGDSTGAFMNVMGGNNGTVNGTITIGVAGAIANDPDTSISLAGNGNIQISSSAVTSFTDLFSIQAWVRQTNGTASIGAFGDAIWGKGSGAPFVWVTGSNASPAGRVVLAKADNRDIVATTSAHITDTAWHHVVVTYAHNVAAKIYVDGVDSGGTPTYDAFSTNSTPAGIGSKYGFPLTDPWHGGIDEVAIYDYVLSEAQALKHFQVGTGAVVSEDRMLFGGL